nr:hypothetical protein [Caballeronia sp. SBC2]
MALNASRLPTHFGVFIAVRHSVRRRRNHGDDAAIAKRFASLDAVVDTVGDDPINGQVRWQDPIHSFAIRHVSARDLDRVDIHLRINRQVHLAPRRAGRLLTVLLFVPLASPVEARTKPVSGPL